MSEMLAVFALLVGISFVCHVSSETYYVTPPSTVEHAKTNSGSNTTPNLNTDTWMTLSDFASDHRINGDPNTTLVLQPGDYTTDSDIAFENMEYLAILVNASNYPAARITCQSSSGIRLLSIANVYISGIEIVGCVSNSVTLVDRFTLEDCSLIGNWLDETGFHLEQVTIGHIERCNFSSSTGRTIFQPIDGYGKGGGALSIEVSDVKITKCYFVENIAESGGSIFVAGSNLSIVNSSFMHNKAHMDSIQSVLSTSQGGSLAAFSSKVTINDNSAFFNNTADKNGGAIFASKTDVTVHASTFQSNSVIWYGGALYVEDGNVTLANSEFHDNIADSHGGAIAGTDSNILISRDNIFCKNRANIEGGAVSIEYSRVTIQGSKFLSNTAKYDSGAIYLGNINKMFHYAVIHECDFLNNFANDEGAVGIVSSNVQIEDSRFVNNTANTGAAVGISCNNDCTVTLLNSVFVDNTAENRGAINIDHAKVTINGSEFFGNMASGTGGALAMSFSDSVLVNTTFAFNEAPKGGAIYAELGTLVSQDSLDIHNNIGNKGIIYVLDNPLTLLGNASITKNFGSLFAFNSGVFFEGYVVMMNNSYNTNFPSIQQGGAVTCFQSVLNFRGTVNLSFNTAQNGSGGAILAVESTINVYDNGVVVTIENNNALSGGGIFAYQSEINLAGNVYLTGNRAEKTGGGIHAVSGKTNFYENTLQFRDNFAEKGGGLYLELNSKLYILKTEQECLWYSILNNTNNICPNTDRRTWLRLQFIENSAILGGAIYVSDSDTSGTCVATPFREYSASSECFLQSLALHSVHNDALNLVNVYFANNSASTAGQTIFGGLLDRCKVSEFAEIFNKDQQFSSLFIDGVYYIGNITNLQRKDIQNEMSSAPVRVCFCQENQHNCIYKPPPFRVIKGQKFTVSIVAVDQVNNTVQAIIHTLLSSQSGGLGEGQITQNTTENCTELSYTIFSSNASEELFFYAEGPCKDIGIGKKSAQVHFLPCPVGFKLTESESSCDCDPSLKPFVTTCFIENATLLRTGEFWIDSVNTTNDSSYLIYSHCPFDYCYPSTKEVFINLNVSDGSDAQCAYNHSGKLCGKCKPGFSLSLGSTHCRRCSSYWLLLFIAFALAGIVLVAFLLILNLTVAIGTTSGLVLYANIIAANQDVFLPFNKTNVFIVFISWLNLDFGFETCFYDGMDAYVKTWLQFAFPLYIIFLVVAIIVISDYSNRFAKLFVGRNPVATLATLILLSYTKLLRAIIAALSFAQLTYPDGSNEIVWLIDANVAYLQGKHIPLFIVAAAIALVGTAYTLVLFFWQWPLKYSKRTFLLRWTTNTKILAFMDAYHAPYNSPHRYWTGMLFLIRSLLYLINAVNILGDPRVNLVSIICVMVFLFTLYAVVQQKPLQSYSLNLLELASYFNLTFFTSLSFYFKDSHGNQVVLAYISTTIALILFGAIVLYHTYLFASKDAREKIKIIARCFCVRNVQNESYNGTTELPNLAAVPYETEPTVTEVDANPNVFLNLDTLENGNSCEGITTAPIFFEEFEKNAVTCDHNGDEIEPLLITV